MNNSKSAYINLLQQSNFDVNYWLLENRNFDYDTSCSYQYELDNIKYTRYNMVFPDNGGYNINQEEQQYLEITEEELKDMLEKGEVTQEEIDEYNNQIVNNYDPNSDLSDIQFIADVVTKIKTERQNDLEYKINKFNTTGKYFYSQ